VFLARARHIGALEAALGHVVIAGQHTSQLELLAEELRLAQEQLGRITGTYTSDDLLGEIFARFCIGK
jgi:tRNA modification GTPase